MKSLSVSHECSLTNEHGKSSAYRLSDVHFHVQFYIQCLNSSEIFAKFLNPWLPFFIVISPTLLDHPAPLVSSDKSVSMPVEASIEDLHVTQYGPCGDSLQADARLSSTPSGLEEKLDRELRYHKHGNYLCDAHSDAANSFHRHTSNPFLPNYLNVADNTVRQPTQEVSSVQSWTKGEPAQIIGQEDAWPHPTSGLYDSMRSSSPHFPTSVSTPSLPPFNPQHPHTNLDRQKSWPAYPVLDTAASDTTAGCLLTSTTSSSLQDPGT